MVRWSEAAVHLAARRRVKALKRAAALSEGFAS
jgi:hypothetical protein